MEFIGAYTADRAAALSGVPKSTIHYWARSEVLVPSVSPERVKLWSYSDLLGLRFIYWLRRPKVAEGGWGIPRTSMPTVRRALRLLHALDLDLFEEGRPTVLVDGTGHVIVDPPGESPRTLEGQLVLRDVIDLIAPFTADEGLRGPDLARPSQFVRIVPRKLAGAPHIVETRVETQALHTLEVRGFSHDRIARLYPALDPAAIEDALRVERQLAENLRPAA
jgi:uncharacterized protein (DUF433 family)